MEVAKSKLTLNINVSSSVFDPHLQPGAQMFKKRSSGDDLEAHLRNLSVNDIDYYSEYH